MEVHGSKSDSNYIESANHPYLKNSAEPQTSSATRAKCSGKRARGGKQACDDKNLVTEMEDTGESISSRR